MNLPRLNGTRAEGIDLYYFLWANRCHDLGFNTGTCGWNKKGNVVAPRIEDERGEMRTFFTSFQKANDCTLAQTARLFGDDAAVQQYARRASLRVAVAGQDALSFARDHRFIDVCLMQPEALTTRARGIVLDYEVQDGRTREQTLAFLKEFAALVHKHHKLAILYTNPLDAPTQRYTGMAASIAHQVYAAFDRTGILLWHHNRQGDIAQSAKAQLAMLRSGGQIDARRLMPIFELHDTTVAEAETVRQLIESDGMPGVILWQNYAEVGGACGTDTNRKIACLVFGRCH